MPKRSHTDMARLTLHVPRGHDGFWTVIRQLDAEGPWTQRDVVDRCNVDRASIKDFVLRLVAGRFAEQVGVKPNRGTGNVDAKLYRLLRTQLETPRLNRKGEPYPEPLYATLWRSMKMTKVFTVEELAQLASTEERPITVARTRNYLNHLERAGVVLRAPSPSRGKTVHFRLARNLGPKAPSVMQTHVVFDPNSRQVIGEAVATEVRL